MNSVTSTDARVKDAAFILHQATNNAQFAILMVHTFGATDLLKNNIDRLEEACARARELLHVDAETEDEE